MKTFCTSLALAVCCLTGGSFAAGVTFTDITPNHWARPAISVMVDRGYMSGYGDNTFRPLAPMSREEVAALFNKVLGNTSPVMLSSSFTDITSDRWSATAIESVARMHIIDGYDDKTYRPDKLISRQEFAVVVDNYLHYIGYETDDPTALDDIVFGDQKYIESWAQSAVRNLAVLGLIHYTPHTMFNPENYLTRAEAAEIIYRLTYAPQSVALHNAINRQRTERALRPHLQALYPTSLDFYREGIMFWDSDTLIVGIKDAKDLKKLAATVADDDAQELKDHVSLLASDISHAEYDLLSPSVAAAYRELEPGGTVLSSEPDVKNGGVILVVDRVSDTAKKELRRRYAKKLTVKTLKEHAEELGKK